MTIGGALSELNNLLKADDIPCYYKPSIKAVMDTIALEQEPKTGYWIRVDKNKVRCSACEVIHLIAQYPNGKIDWCPNCGADMRGTEE